MIRLGWFSTGRGPGSRALLKTVMEQKEKGLLDIELSFVFCNWDNEEENNPRRDQRAEFFDMVRYYGIPLVTLSWKSFRPDLWENDQEGWRREYGKEMRRLISPYPFDLGVLAGYMLWMDDETCSLNDLINLHPALPDGPKGTWQEVIWQLMEEGATAQGAMIHLCTPEWDRGQALTYCRFPLYSDGFLPLWDDFREKVEKDGFAAVKAAEGTEEPLFKKIREEGAKRELPLIVHTIKKFADGVVSIRNQRLFVDGSPLEGAYDLSDVIDASLMNGEF